MTKCKTFINSTGSYLPKKILTNKLLEEMVDTTDEWIFNRTGIKQRRIAEEEELTSDLGVKAAIKALEKAREDVSCVDLIIVATLSPDYIFPSTACVIQKKLGANCPAFDIGAACSGMLFAIATAKSYISSGLYKKVLVIAPEKVSSIIDYTDRGTCVLFGDGASAILLSDTPSTDSAVEVGEVVLGSDGTMHKALEIPSGGSSDPVSKHSIENKQHFLKMDGKTVFRHAIKRMTSSIQQCLLKSELSVEDVDYFIPHQANQRIIEALLKRFSIDEKKVHKNVINIGNTCAASVGICIDEYFDENKKKEENILLTAFGAGFTWGSVILKRREK